MTSDAELLRRYSEDHSESAFAELVGRHLGLVYGTALRQLGSPQHAKDVAQVVFIDLARKATVLARRSVLASWLHTSMRFAAAKVRRADQRRRHYEQTAETMKAILADDNLQVDWERLRPLIDEVVGELSDHDRDAIIMRFFENMAFLSIGETLGISEDASRMRVDRALGKVRRLLERRGIRSTSSALSLAISGHTVGAVQLEQPLILSPSL